MALEAVFALAIAWLLATQRWALAAVGFAFLLVFWFVYGFVTELVRELRGGR
jgi:hypothetical protein